MPSSRWTCTNNSKTMVLRIVHPGGHVELHDRPVIAAEIMGRNPRCCVTYPYVFQQPWAIVTPDTMLMIGQKYYVVPISTVRKLQGLSPRNSPSPKITISPSAYNETRTNKQSSKAEIGDDGMISSSCCVFKKKSIAKKSNNNYRQHSKIDSQKPEIRSNPSHLDDANDKNKNSGLLHDNWFVDLLNGVMTKANITDMTKETRTSSSSSGDSNTRTPTRKRNKDLTRTKRGPPPKRAWSSELWQPSLNSITEES